MVHMFYGCLLPNLFITLNYLLSIAKLLYLTASCPKQQRKQFQFIAKQYNQNNYCYKQALFQTFIQMFTCLSLLFIKSEIYSFLCLKGLSYIPFVNIFHFPFDICSLGTFTKGALYNIVRAATGGKKPIELQYSQLPNIVSRSLAGGGTERRARNCNFLDNH